MPSFFNGKRFFLTYAQTEEPAHELVAFLQQRGDVKSYVVGRERHADGGHHLHCCVEFQSAVRKPANWLDFHDKHPNKQDPRNWAACRTYCKKEGDYLEGPDEREQELRDCPLEACRSFNDETLWMVYCIGKQIAFPYARWLWERIHTDTATLTTNEHDGTISEPLASLHWREQKCLILRGDTGCGKTTWAKRNMPMPCLFVSHVDTLKQFRVGYHKSIIFDDIDVKHWPRTSQIHLVDFENARDIHCRYTTAHIPAGIFKVFTCNEWPLVDDPAILRRVSRITIRN